MPRKKTKTTDPATPGDFHFRMPPEMRERLERAAKLFQVQGDRRRKSPTARPTELLMALLEFGLEAVEAGASVVQTPTMREKSARQERPGGGYYLAPLQSSEVYADLLTTPRTLAPAEFGPFDADARHVVPGTEVKVRGRVFSPQVDAAHVGKAGTVEAVARRQATIRPRRGKPLTVHVYDLTPDVPGLQGLPVRYKGRDVGTVEAVRPDGQIVCRVEREVLEAVVDHGARSVGFSVR